MTYPDDAPLENNFSVSNVDGTLSHLIDEGNRFFLFFCMIENGYPPGLLVVVQNSFFPFYAEKNMVVMVFDDRSLVVVVLLQVNSSSLFFPYVERFHHLLSVSLLPAVVIVSVSVMESDDGGDGDDDDDVFYEISHIRRRPVCVHLSLPFGLYFLFSSFAPDFDFFSASFLFFQLELLLHLSRLAPLRYNPSFSPQPLPHYHRQQHRQTHQSLGLSHLPPHPLQLPLLSPSPLPWAQLIDAPVTLAQL